MSQLLLPLDSFPQAPSPLPSNTSSATGFDSPAKELGQPLPHSHYNNQDQGTSSSSGLGSGSESGSASVNGESETSDYQRSTPSPRDDPFAEQHTDPAKNSSKVNLNVKTTILLNN